MKSHWASVKIGLLCAAVAFGTPIAILVAQLFLLAPSYDAAVNYLLRAANNIQPIKVDLGFVLKALVFAPIIENGIMGLILNALRAVRVPGALSAVLFFVYGWWVHGASIINFGHGFGFMIMTLQWLALRRHASFKTATYFTIISHFVWNLTGIVTVNAMAHISNS
jgi:hypothetical protein